jgi:hypothetical protein
MKAIIVDARGMREVLRGMHSIEYRQNTVIIYRDSDPPCIAGVPHGTHHSYFMPVSVDWLPDDAAAPVVNIAVTNNPLEGLKSSAKMASELSLFASSAGTGKSKGNDCVF